MPRLPHAHRLLPPACVLACLPLLSRCSVTITIKNRKVTVTGPRGTLSRDFQHFRVDLRVEKKGNVSHDTKRTTHAVRRGCGTGLGRLGSHPLYFLSLLLSSRPRP
jgi:hypothetical protein